MSRGKNWQRSLHHSASSQPKTLMLYKTLRPDHQPPNSRPGLDFKEFTAAVQTHITKGDPLAFGEPQLEQLFKNIDADGARFAPCFLCGALPVLCSAPCCSPSSTARSFWPHCWGVPPPPEISETLEALTWPILLAAAAAGSGTIEVGEFKRWLNARCERILSNIDAAALDLRKQSTVWSFHAHWIWRS